MLFRYDEENNSQQKTEETHSILNQITEEVSDRQNDVEGNTNNDEVPFVYPVSYRALFSYCWIGMGSQILILDFLEQDLKRTLVGPCSRNYEPSLLVIFKKETNFSSLHKEVIKRQDNKFFQYLECCYFHYRISGRVFF